MDKEKEYDKLESIVREKVIVLENENRRLHQELALATAELKVYHRLLNMADSKVTLGFGPPSFSDITDKEE